MLAFPRVALNAPEGLMLHRSRFHCERKTRPVDYECGLTATSPTLQVTSPESSSSITGNGDDDCAPTSAPSTSLDSRSARNASRPSPSSTGSSCAFAPPVPLLLASRSASNASKSSSSSKLVFLVVVVLG